MVPDEKYLEIMNDSKKESFWKNLQYYIRNVTGIHGLYYLTEQRTKVEKIFWVCVLLLSLGGCIFMIIQIVAKYNENPVVVSFATQESPNYEIPFPAVTICLESKCNMEKFNISNISDRFNDRQHTLTNQELKYFYYMNTLCHTTLDDSVATNKVNFADNIEEDFYNVIDEIKPSVQLICSTPSFAISCDDYMRPIITDEGICYTFNIFDRNHIYKKQVFQYNDFHLLNNVSVNYDMDNGYNDNAGVYTYPSRALTSDADNSFSILFVHPSSKDEFVCNGFVQGFRVLLHSPNDIPRVSKSYFRVSLNKAVTAAVKPDLTIISDGVKKMKPENRNCYLVNERPLQYFKKYSQSNCLLECLTNYTLKTCGCVRFYMPRFNDTKICGVSKNSCVNFAATRQTVEELQQKLSGTLKSYESYCDCKPSCTNLRYSVEVSDTDFSWKKYIASHSNFSTMVNDTEKDISALTIYFKDEQFIPIERKELYGTSDFISNFGGLLGLFTGFSLISLVELFYFATVRLFYNLKLFGRWWGE